MCLANKWKKKGDLLAIQKSKKLSPYHGVNQFYVADLYLYPQGFQNLKTLRFSDVFRGYRKRQMTWNGLKRKIFGYWYSRFTFTPCKRIWIYASQLLDQLKSFLLASIKYLLIFCLKEYHKCITFVNCSDPLYPEWVYYTFVFTFLQFSQF